MYNSYIENTSRNLPSFEFKNNFHTNKYEWYTPKWALYEYQKNYDLCMNSYIIKNICIFQNKVIQNLYEKYKNV